MVTTKDKIQAYILLTVISSLKYVVSKINEYVSEYFLVIYIIYRHRILRTLCERPVVFPFDRSSLISRQSHFSCQPTGGRLCYKWASDSSLDNNRRTSTRKNAVEYDSIKRHVHQWGKKIKCRDESSALRCILESGTRSRNISILK